MKNSKDRRVPVSLCTKAGGMRVVYLCHHSAWVPDSARSACVVCRASFNLFVRKHHCRMCGDIVCGPCTRFLGSQRIRACTKCVGASLVEFARQDSQTTSLTTSSSGRFVVPTTCHPIYKNDALTNGAALWTKPFHLAIVVCIMAATFVSMRPYAVV
ncbi:hypothetical protein LEN26_011902 [Aphanomyces euteiches]|nr:hypothetical protein LEN26_011902 [Aphanomyces euteiches]KAH9127576.1 hypothetical protein AeMF1_002140 [Aphanomyces euteiches]KAH9183416.1 hypothetical protein AeNC1_014609 [Aphanomyces euteiches]